MVHPAFVRGNATEADAAALPAHVLAFVRHEPEMSLWSWPTLDQDVNRLRWLATRLDWTEVDHVEVRLSDEVPDLGGTLIGRHAMVAAYYQPGWPVVVGPQAVVMTELDLLYWTSPGYRCLFGAGERVEPRCDLRAFAETDEITLRAARVG